MFGVNRKVDVFNQQSSYFYYQYKKRKAKYRFRLLLVLVLLTAGLATLAIAYAEQTTVHGNEHLFVPQLVLDDGLRQSLIAYPVNTSASVEVNGLIAYVEINQTFVNVENATLNGKYQFPLPSEAAVNYLNVRIGDREIVGEIMEKKAAKATFDKAKRQGKKASLVRQQRANLFTNNIANIDPLAEISVTLRFVMPVTYQQGRFSIALPVAMTERYKPLNFQQSPAERDSEFFPAMPMAKQSSLQVNVELNAGVAVENIRSASHQIIVENTDSPNNPNGLNNHYKVSLTKGEMPVASGFELSWQLSPAETPKIASYSEQVGDDFYTIFTFFPAENRTDEVLPRDVIFIIDTSGSMQGPSMSQAKASLRHALSLLSYQDSFNIIAFNNDSKQLFHATHMRSDESLARANQFINQLYADGGTEMLQPLNQALLMPSRKIQSEDVIKQIVFITDGAVANEFELMQLLQRSDSNFRLFTVGIGSAPNSYFMKKAAQFGRGSSIFIQSANEMGAKMADLMTKISQPSLADINLSFDQQIQQTIEVFPRKLPDLYLGEPIQVAVKSSLPLASAQVTGKTATVPFYQQLIIESEKQAKAVSKLWAKRKIDDLLDGLVTGEDAEQVKSEVLNTSLAHQILSPYTSFIAVEKSPDIEQLLASNRLKQLKETLAVAMPKTALGWQQQLILGLLLLAITCLIASRTFAKTNA